MRTRHEQRGFLFLLTLFTLTGMLTLSVVGLGRSLTETSAATRYVATQQAFHQAEAGIDYTFQWLTSLSQQDLTQVRNDLPNSLSCPGIAGCVVSFVDNEDGDGNMDLDTDGLITISAQGTVGPVAGSPLAQQTVQAMVQLATSSGGPFDYVLGGDRLKISGNAVIGDELDRFPIYVQSYSWKQCPTCLEHRAFEISSAAATTTYPSRVDFVNPKNQPLTDPALDSFGYDVGLCPGCTSFPPNLATGEPKLNLSGVSKLPPISVDLGPYYDRAIAQCMADTGAAQAACENGSTGSYHHITADTTITQTAYPAGLDGVIYVESGVTVTFQGDLEIRGTVVHEGTYAQNLETYDNDTTPFHLPYWCSSGCSFYRGAIELKAQGGNKPNFTVLSSAETVKYYDVDGVPGKDAPFAKGMAVVGAPIMRWSNQTFLGPTTTTTGIDGFVMAGGVKATECSANCSNIASEGRIDGGIVGVDHFARHPSIIQEWSGTDIYGNPATFGNYGFPVGIPGPSDSNGRIGPVAYRFANFELGGPARIQFEQLPESPPGFTGNGSSQKPILLYWSSGTD